MINADKSISQDNIYYAKMFVTNSFPFVYHRDYTTGNSVTYWDINLIIAEVINDSQWMYEDFSAISSL